MAQVLAAAFSAKFPDELPSWIDPFLKAARRLEILEKREQDGKTVTSDNKPKDKVTKKKKKKTSRKGKGKEVSEQDEGLANDVEDAVMMACAEEFLETVRSWTLPRHHVCLADTQVLRISIILGNRVEQ